VARFNYVARNQEGQTRTGVLEATDREAALATLSQQFEIVTNLDPIEAAPLSGLTFRASGRISSEELLVFTQQMAAMLEGGVIMARAFDLMVQETRNPAMRNIVVDLTNHVRSGGRFAEALERHPKVFPRFYCSLVAAGEASGNLPQVMERLAGYLERSEKVRRQVAAAMIYPAIVIVFALLTVAALLVLGVPLLSDLYAGMGEQLPWSTRTFVAVSTFLNRTWYLWTLALVGLGLALRRFLETAAGQGLIQRLTLTLWPFKLASHDLALARFTHTLATLYSSGIRFNDSLPLVASAIGFQAYEREILKARDRVVDGELLSVALRRGRLFSSLLIGMIAAGEESGTLDRMLDRLSNVFEARFEATLRALVATLEPLLIIAIGMLVALIIFVLCVPFLTLSTKLI